MKTIETILDSSLMHCLGWTLVHFLWQGVAVGVIYFGVRQMLRGRSPASRYHLAMCALAIMALLPIITFIHLTDTFFVGAAADGGIHSFAAISTLGERQDTTTVFFLMERMRHLIQPLIPWAVPFWLLGVCATMMRVVRGWHHAYQLRETATFIPLHEWYSVVNSLCSLFGINKIVYLAVSTSVSVPSVVGWLKPIILIPPSTIAGLTPLQMELILAHELAHIRRQDYLWNLMQLAVETLLFYHPVVHWISQQGRLEREQCCDDMVVEKHGHAVEYARALTELESLRHARDALLLGANGGQVINRIHRLLGMSAPEAPVFWLPLMLIAGFLISASLVQFSHQKATLQSLLSSKYTILADVRQPHVYASVKSAAYQIPPTKIHMDTGTQSANLKPVSLIDTSSGIVLKELPSLAKARYSVETIVNVPKLAVHTLPKQAVTPASVIEKHAPVYPVLAQERGVEGSATVEFTLTAEGDITEMHVTHVSGSGQFAQAAINALTQWKISPATVGGIPVAQHMSEEFIFQLKPPVDNDGTCKIPVGYHVCGSN